MQKKPRWLTVAWVCSRADLVVTIFLLGALAVSTFAIRKGPIVLGHFGFIDSSWALNIAFNNRHGIRLGRDVSFTYGQLFQWILGSSAWFHGWSIGAFFKYGDWLSSSYILVGIWIVSLLLLGGQPVWKRVFYIVALAVFWMYWDVRLMTDVLLFAVAAQQCDRLRNEDASLLRGLFLAFLISVAFLVSSDTGVYSLAAFLIVSISYLYLHRYGAGYAWRVLRFAMWVIAGVVCWTFFIGVFLTGRMGIEFWKTNLASLAGYRWAMSAPMPPDLSFRFYFIADIILTVFVLGLLWRDVRACSLAQRPAYILSAASFSLFMLQSSLVRSDSWHIFFGLFPGMMLAGAILMGADSERRGWVWQFVPVFAALGLTAVFSPAPNPHLVPSVLVQHVAAYRMPPLQACPAGTSYFDDACFQDSDFQRIYAVAKYLEAHTVPSDWIAVFPYENVYGVAAGRRVAGWILQNYQATGDYLVARQIAGLETEKPPLAVYSADGVTAMKIDSVPNLTRNPEIWLYLQSLYETASEPQPGVLILRRDSGRRGRWSMQATDLRIRQAVENGPLGGNRGLHVARDISWPADADLLKLTVQVHYPFWWHVLKPRHLLVRLSFADGTEKNIVSIAAPDRPWNIWIYPWRDADLMNYFSARESSWRAAQPRTPVQSVWITTAGTDAFSVDPTSIRVTGLQAVRFSLKASQ